jgi:alpha-beta hydrolase superfamily lysophospholipase
MGRFQEWSEDWKTASKAQKKTQLVDVSKISDVPMTFIFAGEDTSCPPAVQKQFVEQITAPKKSITIDGKSHSYFGSPTDESFAGVLAAELVI